HDPLRASCRGNRSIRGTEPMMARTAGWVVRVVDGTAFTVAILAGCLYAPPGHAQAGGSPTTTTPPAAAPVPVTTPHGDRSKPVASESDCKKYVAALAGRSEDKALMNDDTVKALAKRAPDLVACGAVKADKDAHCQVLAGDEQALRACRLKWATFHELRNN